jgi:teichuronic acid biosynthesis glycosyltransferase TuaG
MHQLGRELVSVIIAAHNAERWLQGAFESLVRQSHSNWEAIIVDDASTDGTAQIAESFDDDRVRVYRLGQNVGSGAARNVAISHARGEYLAILDADDICMPKRLEIQLGLFRQDPTLAVVGGQVAEFGDWGGPTITRWPTSSAVIAQRLQQMRMPLAHCAAMFRANVVRDHGGYDEAARRAQDFALLLKIRQYPMRSSDQVVLLYRRDLPSKLAYIIASGRSGRIVRRKARRGDWSDRGERLGLPGSWWVDTRSIIQWLQERTRHSQSKS